MARRLVLGVLALAACTSGPDGAGGSTSAGTTAISAVSRSTTSTSSTSTSSTSSTSTTSASTTSTTATTTTTVPPGGALATLVADPVQVIEIGRSVEGRPITAIERGTPGGAVVLMIGVIHGDEDDGVAILERLATAEVPAGVDLWLVESMNPDGQLAGRRTNANLVDLNRNFPYDWAPLGQPGDSQYGGIGPASEPETQAMVELISAIRPALGIWYHQDLFRIAPGSGPDRALRSRYAELTGLPLLDITGGTYTGVAATWQRRTVEDGAAFIVELGPTLSEVEAATHAAAVLDLAARVTAQLPGGGGDG